MSGADLANWLSSYFGKVFGTSLSGASGEDLTDFYRSELFKQKAKKSAGPAKVDAKFMAVALAPYFTSGNLAGMVASDYGFNVTDTGIGTSIFNVGNNGEAFHLADNSNVAVLDLLFATDDQSLNGALYDLEGDGDADDDRESLPREVVNDVFGSINE